MNASDIISLRLKNHLLAGTDKQTPQEVVSWMGAIQAQDYNMAKWGIGNRISKITDSQIDESVNKGDIIRTHILRPTWHFISKNDISWMLPLSAPRVKMTLRSSDKDLDLDEAIIAKTNSIIRKELSIEANLTRQELGSKLKASGINLDNGRRLNHIMLHAELNGVVCSGVIKGKKQTYRLLEDLVSFGKFDKDESLYKLACKYFRSHGPATIQDFIWWSGLTTSEANRSLELIKEDFLFEYIDSQQYIYQSATPDSTLHKDVHLLPAFDEYLVSYRDRKEILHPLHHKKVITSNGIFQPFILHKGEIIGVWKKVPTKDSYEINTDYFDSLTKVVQKNVDKEVRSVLSFLS